MIVTRKELEGLTPLTITEKTYVDRDGNPQIRRTEVFLLHEDTVVEFLTPDRKRWKLQTPQGDFPPYMHIRIGSTDVHNFNFEGGSRPRVNIDEDGYCVGSVEIKARVVTSTGGDDVNIYVYANIHPVDTETEPTHEMVIKATKVATETPLSWLALNFRVSTRIELISITE